MKKRLSRVLHGHLVDVFEPEAVTSIGVETSPEAVGLTPQVLEEIWQAAEALYRTRLYPAISLCVRYKGEVIVDRAMGHIRGNAPDDGPESEKILATPSSLFNLFSASKVFTAMLVHHLDDKGLLHLDDAIAEYIPEFAKHGKGATTIRHVLTHRAGIPAIPDEGLDLDIFTNEGEIIRLICVSKPTSVAGRRLAYHAITGGFILGEVCKRVSGLGMRELMAKVVQKPLGLKHLNFGVKPEELPLIAQDAFTGPNPPEPFKSIMRRALGLGLQDAVTFANDPRFLTAVVPAGNVISTANEACLFFEMLRQDGAYNGTQIFDRRTVHRAISEQSYLELDTTLLLPVRYGMGFMLGADYLSFYGLQTPKAYGHVGFTNTLAYADPERELSCCLMTSGKPFVHRHVFTWLNLMNTIAKALPRTRK